MNMRLCAYHATLGLGAKLGGVPSAAAEKLKLPARYIAPARAPRVKFPACLAIGSSSATLLGAGRQKLGLARWYEQPEVASGPATRKVMSRGCATNPCARRSLTAPGARRRRHRRSAGR